MNEATSNNTADEMRFVFWPLKDTVMYRMAVDMIRGAKVWATSDSAPERIEKFESSIAALRAMGWPVVATAGPAEAVGFQYELPDDCRVQAADVIKGMAAANALEV